MPQPDVIMMSMTTALTQCMILRGQGCSRRHERGDEPGSADVGFPSLFMNSISSQKAARK
jgi:hypothetical protein